MKYNVRYIARITVESETPISVGSGEKGLLTDRLVAKDANGLPYIPGTSLTGVLRHSLSTENFIDDIFGSSGEKGTGSRLIVSSALLVGYDGKTVLEGLKNIDFNSSYYSFFDRLPERDHVRMTDKGAADSENHGKYDEQLVHKGTRFVFELELIGHQSDKENWLKLLQALASPVFRIGSGTRKGFGKLKIINDLSKFKNFNLTDNEELLAYLNKSSSLNDSIESWSTLNLNTGLTLNNWTNYSLELKAKNFFLFGAGFGDEDADNKPKAEKYFDWSNGKPELVEKEFLLIPATSIKGIIAHRVAYHYNKEKGIQIGGTNEVSLTTNFNLEEAIKKIDDEFNIETLSIPSNALEWNILEEKINNLSIGILNDWTDFEEKIDLEVHDKGNSVMPVGENNEAIKALFGYAKNSDLYTEGLRGRVVIDDIYLSYKQETDKIFNHVKIDRFTNGTIDGALFQEKTSQFKDYINIEIWVDNKAFEVDEAIKIAFENTLNDIISGNLQLGGNSTKGHGVFTGTLKIK
jgi:CRISPR/Cas system CSM-associated protein Csm3 (group 7 of RAMP superfamily)